MSSALPLQLPELAIEIQYALLIFLLFIVPRFFSRFGIPTALITFVFGATFALFFDLFSIEPMIGLLSTLGIVSLFLFAGLDVDFVAVFKHQRVLLQYMLMVVILPFVCGVFAYYFLDLPLRAATLFALALVTPSTGFILDSLGGMSLADDRKFWIRTKAIAFELLALALLFIAVQSTTWTRISLSSLALGGMILVLPVIFRIFAHRIAPYAPNSEFGFLLMLALACALITTKLGAYYLVGAFVVGVVAQRFELLLPSLVSEEMLHSLRVFASFFIPFYFFGAGMSLSPSEFDLRALELGAMLLVVMIPIRIGSVAGFRKYFMKETLRESLPVAINLLPTLVFGLVISGILKKQFDVSPEIFGALIVYTFGVTLIPLFLRRFLKAA